MSAAERPAGGTARVHTFLESPVGELTVVAEGGSLVGVYFADPRHGPGELGRSAPADPTLRRVCRELRGYFVGSCTRFDIPVVFPAGSPFQRQVWRALQDIPYGETVSYGELAARLGRPAAARAVGGAVGRNPVSVVVPCHRVVGATGALTGFGGGLDRKQTLLDVEQRGRRR